MMSIFLSLALLQLCHAALSPGESSKVPATSPSILKVVEGGPPNIQSRVVGKPKASSRRQRVKTPRPTATTTSDYSLTNGSRGRKQKARARTTLPTTSTTTPAAVTWSPFIVDLPLVTFKESTSKVFRDAIYTAVSNPRLTHADAAYACASHSGELATAKTIEELNFLKDLIRKSGNPDQAWYLNGGKGTRGGRNHVWFDDESPIQQWFYSPGQPDFGPKADCASIWEYLPVIGGDDTRCDRPMSFICKKLNRYQPPIPKPSPFETTREDFRDATYTLFTRPTLNHADARLACASLGEELTTVKTSPEFNFLKDFIQRSGKRGHSWFVNGGKGSNGRDHVWLDDNSIIQPFFYGPGQPDYSPYSNCASIWDYPGYYFGGDDTHCSRQLPFICKRRKPYCVPTN